MIILSVDYGDARTGLALCDREEMLAFPLGVIAQRDTEQLAFKIASLAAQKNAQMIVLGYPKNMDGSEGFKAQSVNAFAALLKERTALPVALWDERLTTVSAHRILSENNVRGKKRKGTVDAVAAVLILQNFLDYRKHFQEKSEG